MTCWRPSCCRPGVRPEGAYNALVQLYEVFEAATRDPDVRIRSPERRRLLSIMLMHGLDPARTTSLYGDSMLHTLCRYGAPIDDILLLLENNRTLANTKNAGGDMPLQCYIKNAETLRIGVVRALLEHGADATIEDGQGRPLLSLLDRRGHVPGLRDMLVQNGAHSDEMRLP